MQSKIMKPLSIKVSAQKNLGLIVQPSPSKCVHLSVAEGKVD